jgi:hypothetical protein
MLNPHIPSRNEENAQKLKQNEFFASHARALSPETGVLAAWLGLGLPKSARVATREQL